MKYNGSNKFKRAEQKTFSKTYKVGEILSDDGLDWFNQTLELFSKSNGIVGVDSDRIVTTKFTLTFKENKQ